MVRGPWIHPSEMMEFFQIQKNKTENKKKTECVYLWMAWYYVFYEKENKQCCESDMCTMCGDRQRYHMKRKTVSLHSYSKNITNE